MEELHKVETWVDNFCHKFGTFWHGLEEFKEPAAYFDRVGDNVKKLFSDVVDDIKADFGSPKHKNSSVSFINSEISETNASVSEDESWGMPFIVDQSEKKIKNDSLMNNKEKETLINRPVNESECCSDTLTTHQSSELESWICCSENKDGHIFGGGLLTEKCDDGHFVKISHGPKFLYDSENSSYETFSVKSDTNDYNSTTLVDYLSTSGSNSNNEASTMRCPNCGAADESTIKFEDIKIDADNFADEKQLVKVFVDVESNKPLDFPSRSKSYKKIIKDVFMSKKKLAKEYRQLPVLFADIESELSQPTDKNTQKSPAQDSPLSEWELL